MKVIEKFMTGLGWFLMLSYILQIILSLLVWAFNLSNFYKKLIIMNNITNTIKTLIITGVISLLGFLIMYGWGRYNYNKYAHLRRRKFSEDITVKEIISYFNLPLEVVETMQNNKLIVLEKTIV